MTGIPQTQEEIRAAVEARAAEIEGTAETGTTPVSYTHLTLPTILRV